MSHIDQKIPIPGPSVAARIVEGQALLLDPAATELRRMNPVGSFVWGLIMERSHPVGNILAAVVEQFEVESSVAEADLVTFLEKLEAEGLITYKSD